MSGRRYDRLIVSMRLFVLSEAKVRRIFVIFRLWWKGKHKCRLMCLFVGISCKSGVRYEILAYQLGGETARLNVPVLRYLPPLFPFGRKRISQDVTRLSRRVPLGCLDKQEGWRRWWGGSHPID